MNRRTLTGQVSDKVGIPASVVEKVFLEILDAVRQQLAQKGHLILKGLGSFTVASYGARKYHNPHTGKIITVPTRKWVKFKMSLAMRRLLTQATREPRPATASTRQRKSRQRPQPPEMTVRQPPRRTSKAQSRRSPVTKGRLAGSAPAGYRGAGVETVARILREDGRRWLVGIHQVRGVYQAFLRLETGGAWEKTGMVGRLREDILEVIDTAWALPEWHLEYPNAGGWRRAT